MATKRKILVDLLSEEALYVSDLSHMLGYPLGDIREAVTSIVEELMHEGFVTEVFPGTRMLEKVCPVGGEESYVIRLLQSSSVVKLFITHIRRHTETERENVLFFRWAASMGEYDEYIDEPGYFGFLSFVFPVSDAYRVNGMDYHYQNWADMNNQIHLSLGDMGKGTIRTYLYGLQWFLLIVLTWQTHPCFPYPQDKEAIRQALLLSE